VFVGRRGRSGVWVGRHVLPLGRTFTHVPKPPSEREQTVKAGCTASNERGLAGAERLPVGGIHQPNVSASGR